MADKRELSGTRDGTDMLFEDFVVGRRIEAGPVRATAEHVRLGLACGGVIAGALWREATMAVGESREVAESWTWHRAIRADEEISLVATVIRLEESVQGEQPATGRVIRHQELIGGDGAPVQTGTAVALVDRDSSRARTSYRDIGTPAWGEALAEVLADDDRFASATASWDGTMGVRGGEHEIHLRIYRGRIIEVTRRSPHGATFTFGASDRIWADILTSSDARFGVRLMKGEFEITGNPYEYLRLTKALEILVDTTRQLAARDSTHDLCEVAR